MKNITKLQTWSLLLLSTVVLSCSSGKFKGSASDTTGTNGATTGTGKIYPLN